MIIQKTEHFYNEAAVRFSPTQQESRYIQYLLKQNGYSLVDIGVRLLKSKQIIHSVIYGHRRSRRVESAIAHVLGHDDWNSLVIEARLAVSGTNKPTKAQIKKAKTAAIKQHRQLIEQKWAQQGTPLVARIEKIKKEAV